MWTWLSKNGAALSVVLTIVGLFLVYSIHAYTNLDASVDRVDKRVERLEGKFDRLQDTLDTRLDSVEQNQVKLDTILISLLNERNQR